MELADTLTQEWHAANAKAATMQAELAEMRSRLRHLLNKADAIRALLRVYDTPSAPPQPGED